MERKTLLAMLLIAVVISSNVVTLGYCETLPSSDFTSSDVTRLIDAGIEYERKREWAEALTHYEDAVRSLDADELATPEGKRLQRRMGVARLHFELQRRYSDSSFLNDLIKLDTAEALTLFDEVARNIDEHYVDSPNWNAILRNGTTGLSIALSDSEFRKANAIRVSNEVVRSAIDYVWQAQIRRNYQSRQQAHDFVRWAAREIRYRTGLRSTAAVLEYACSATAALDVYSTFLTGDDLDEVYSQIEGNFVGLGVELKPESESLLIANVIPKGPAERAGIRKGDRIIEVDGQSTSDIPAEKAADLLKGEENSYVQIGILRGETVRRLYIRRERVEVPSVEDIGIIDDEDAIGYIRISSFQKSTYEDVNNALWSLHKQGMRTLIIDVRGNPGGLLTESVEIADLFIKQGAIVETRGRSARENSSYRAHESGTWRVPLVVLIDNDSASASEIFAGAIRDHGAGTVVGTRSYGKGSVQGIFPLRTANAGIKLTTAKFYSPSGRTISGNGIEPEIKIRKTARPVVNDDGGFVEVGADDLATDNDVDLILEAGKKAAVQRVMALLNDPSRAGR